jgi:metal-responsive CopG/Arc/MetJ family transcriptional regulator
MKLGEERQDGSINFSISMPNSLYNEIREKYDISNRSKVVIRLVKLGLKHDQK